MIQIISKIDKVTQLAVNYCIRKAVGSLSYTISAPASELLCHAVGNHDYQGVPIIMLSPLYPVAFLFRPLRNNQPVFFAAGTGTRTVPVPVDETSVLYMIK